MLTTPGWRLGLSSWTRCQLLVSHRGSSLVSWSANVLIPAVETRREARLQLKTRNTRETRLRRAKINVQLLLRYSLCDFWRKINAEVQRCSEVGYLRGVYNSIKSAIESHPVKHLLCQRKVQVFMTRLSSLTSGPNTTFQFIHKKSTALTTTCGSAWPWCKNFLCITSYSIVTELCPKLRYGCIEKEFKGT